MAFSSLDYRSTLMRAPFDAARETITGPPQPLLNGTRPIRDHAVSPDGQWIAFTQAGTQEDLFVSRIDGSDYRRLTDDPARDRGPTWSPDGSELAFYSDRSGTYELWKIRPDGSGLTAITSGTGNPGFPVWSPDGKRIAYGYFTWSIIDAAARGLTNPPAEPSLSTTDRFIPMSWSPDGTRLAGHAPSSGGGVGTLVVYDLNSKRYSRVGGDIGRASGWFWPVWLADGRRLVVRNAQGIAIVNPDTGVGHMLLPVGGVMVGESVGVSKDGRWITYTETATEGDVWIATVHQ
jgi:Tol biopolymer transport system component